MSTPPDRFVNIVVKLYQTLSVWFGLTAASLLGALLGADIATNPDESHALKFGVTVGSLLLFSVMIAFGMVSEKEED